MFPLFMCRKIVLKPLAQLPSFLDRKGITAIHGDISQMNRERALRGKIQLNIIQCTVMVIRYPESASTSYLCTVGSFTNLKF